MICLSIAPENIEELKYLTKNITSKQDLLEIRLENLPPDDISKFLRTRNKSYIFTLRKNKNIQESERINLYQKAIECGVKYIDIEFETSRKGIKYLIELAKNHKTKVILSYHNFNYTPDNLISIHNNLKKLEPDIVKIACKANDIQDNLKIFKLLKTVGRNLAAFCMGEKGEISRILAAKYGSYLTYASYDESSSTAEGQIPISKLKKVFRYNNINSDTRIFGLVGNPVAQSKGIYFHNKNFKDNKLNAVYLNFLTNDFKSFLKGYKNILSGLSVTKPFKEIAVKFLDEYSDEVRYTGAVNTIIYYRRKLVGYNTDALALESFLQGKLSRKNVAVLGTGGAARAALYVAKKNFADTIVFGRNIKKANELAIKFKCKFDDLKNIKNHKFDVLINATSVGMYPVVDKSPVEPEIFNKKYLVVDFVYTPSKTKFLSDAIRANCNVISGEQLFYKQAEIQKNIFKQAYYGKKY